ncbi:MaoC family dehydratase [bacterium]|jgi:acyl dehydratase|nr:MaoC family dehydratase [bacterium]
MTADDRLQNFYGVSERTSDWLDVTQERINAFADCTLDHNWIHIDPERCYRESPFGGPIAHGQWTLSTLPHLIESALGGLRPPGIQMGVNYGFDRVRMMTPVPVGKRIRNRMKLIEIQAKGGNRFVVKTENTIEIEGEAKPALVAEWLFMVFVDDV